jgi:hypothetical protein
LSTDVGIAQLDAEKNETSMIQDGTGGYNGRKNSQTENQQDQELNK